jgi:HlyD family secretion protein
MASRRTRTIGLLAVGLVLVVVVFVNATRDSRNRVAVQTQKAGKQDLTSIVSASGEVRPKRFVNVSANVSGRITRILVAEGDRVKKGQLLATIDSTRFEADVKQSEAAVQAQKADLDRALADLDVSRLVFARTEKMFRDKLVSDQVFDQAQAEIKMKLAVVDSLRRRITQWEAAADSSRDNLEKTTVVSPMDGVVTNLAKEEGEVVIGAQSFQPTVIMTVADLSIMEVEVLVDETDIRNVKLGQEGDVRVDALEGVKIKGEVTEIGASAIPRGSTTGAVSGVNTGNQAKDFKVTVTLKDPPAALRPGLNATADIVTARKPGVLAVPIQAVVVREVGKDGKVIDPGAPATETGAAASAPRAAKGEETDGVFVVGSGQAAFRRVDTGIMGETDMEIVDGLKEGEEIVVGSYKTLRTLKDQARIRVERVQGKP